MEMMGAARVKRHDFIVLYSALLVVTGIWLMERAFELPRYPAAFVAMGMWGLAAGLWSLKQWARRVLMVLLLLTVLILGLNTCGFTYAFLYQFNGAAFFHVMFFSGVAFLINLAALRWFYFNYEDFS
jgi:hypothetical protein